MKRQTLFRSLVLAAAVTVGFASQTAAQTTALDDYVAKADPSYGYVRSGTRGGEGYTIFVVSMSSQKWRGPAEVDRVLWTHEVLIAVPWIAHSGNQHTALLVVNGGRNTAESTRENDDLLGLLSVVTGSVTAMVSQIPNEPLHFSDEDDARSEDALLAYGMDKYLRTGDPEWLVQFPMTKAVVRAMDTVQTFAVETSGWPDPPRIDDFIIIGGSKRGWATWLTAAVEAQKGAASRIRAILPASIDLLNLGRHFRHHWEAYGFYAPAIQDYVEFDVPCRARLAAAGTTMLELIDPYSYGDRLTMPKLLLNSAGDQFFLPDSSQFYFADLPGPKRLRYTLNTDHSQAQDLRSIILPTLSWLSDVLDEKAGPQFSWTLEANGSIRVQTYTTPKRVRLWQATNPEARDFRLESIGAAWTSSNLSDAGNGVYVGYVSPPARGWRAFTVEVTFAGSTLLPTPLESDQVFTTDVRVTPDTLPFKGTSCPCQACLPGWSGWRSILR
jgi:PhoPQ-activated pathogenicity-related protein